MNSARHERTFLSEYLNDLSHRFMIEGIQSSPLPETLSESELPPLILHGRREDNWRELASSGLLVRGEMGRCVIPRFPSISISLLPIDAIFDRPFPALGEMKIFHQERVYAALLVGDPFKHSEVFLICEGLHRYLRREGISIVPDDFPVEKMLCLEHVIVYGSSVRQSLSSQLNRLCICESRDRCRKLLEGLTTADFSVPFPESLPRVSGSVVMFPSALSIYNTDEDSFSFGITMARRLEIFHPPSMSRRNAVAEMKKVFETVGAPVSEHRSDHFDVPSFGYERDRDVVEIERGQCVNVTTIDPYHLLRRWGATFTVVLRRANDPWRLFLYSLSTFSKVSGSAVAALLGRVSASGAASLVLSPLHGHKRDGEIFMRLTERRLREMGFRFMILGSGFWLPDRKVEIRFRDNTGDYGTLQIEDLARIEEMSQVESGKLSLSISIDRTRDFLFDPRMLRWCDEDEFLSLIRTNIREGTDENIARLDASLQAILTRVVLIELESSLRRLADIGLSRRQGSESCRLTLEEISAIYSDRRAPVGQLPTISLRDERGRSLDQTFEEIGSLFPRSRFVRDRSRVWLALPLPDLRSWPDIFDLDRGSLRIRCMIT